MLESLAAKKKKKAEEGTQKEDADTLTLRRTQTLMAQITNGEPYSASDVAMLDAAYSRMVANERQRENEAIVVVVAVAKKESAKVEQAKRWLVRNGTGKLRAKLRSHDARRANLKTHRK